MKKLTLKEFCEKNGGVAITAVTLLKVHPQTVYNWINGKIEPSNIAKDKMKELGILPLDK